jgi:lipopolysaccharide/colanic/teichoic acid biosynthesis glycosyltransferase
VPPNNLLTWWIRRKAVAESPELFRLKGANDCYTADINSNALQTEQCFGLSGLRPIQPRFNRIEAGLPRTKASLQSQYSSSTFINTDIRILLQTLFKLKVKLIQSVFNLTS